MLALQVVLFLHYSILDILLKFHIRILNYWWFLGMDFLICNTCWNCWSSSHVTFISSQQGVTSCRVLGILQVVSALGSLFSRRVFLWFIGYKFFSHVWEFEFYTKVCKLNAPLFSLLSLLCLILCYYYFGCEKGFSGDSSFQKWFPPSSSSVW